MNCRMCGELLDDKEKFCPVCGAKQKEPEISVETTILNPVHSHEDDCAHEGYVTGGGGSINIFEAFKLFFLRYTDFQGRSRRSEYWFACLSVGVLSALISGIIPDLAWIWSLAIWVPNLALCVRRLHDIGKSGLWYLINLVPLAGPIIYLVWACKDSTGDNIWGPNPKY